MKKLCFLLLALVTLSAHAQFTSNGYYRVQNKATSRFITVTHDKASVSASSVSADLSALQTFTQFDNVVDDPASVIYIEKTSSGYVLQTQGVNTYNMMHYYMQLRQSGDTYQAYATESGFTLYLWDEDLINTQTWTVIVDSGYVSTNKKDDSNRRQWYIKPVDQTEGQYFDVKPDVQVGSRYYKTFYADFPFTFVASDRKAHVVTAVDETYGIVVWDEVSGTVPAATPVILDCPSATASDNRLNVGASGATAVNGNLLTGVWFNRNDPSMNIVNHIANDPQTMRLLGKSSDGKLAFVKSSTQYLPRNQAYITVSSSAPDELLVMTQSEYEDYKARDVLTVTARSYTREYGEANPTLEYVAEGTPNGEPVLSTTATQQSPVGVYPITVSRGTLTNTQLTTVDGTLTVTAAPLTVTARSYTIRQTDAMPTFEADYAGFKLGQNASVLTTQPVITTDAPADMTPGTYTVTVSGAAAQNYDISYVAGTLTIEPVDTIIITAADVQMKYGDDMPQFTYSATSHDFTGEPLITCEATSASPVGTYSIKVAKGSINYPNLKFVDGTLTISKASLTIKADNKQRMIGEPDPELTVTYIGFRNGDTAASLTVQPTVYTTATADSPEGAYPIIVSGAESPNYNIGYIQGTFTISGDIAVRSITITQPVDVYTLTGRKVRSQVTDLNGLAHGVYVINGRKVVL